jgi:hypothetical protein
MTPETRALLREAAKYVNEQAEFIDVDNLTTQMMYRNAKSLATRLRAAADAGEGEDTKRLDWLERETVAVYYDPERDEDGTMVWNAYRQHSDDIIASAPTLRAAIDAAMREGA